MEDDDIRRGCILQSRFYFRRKCSSAAECAVCLSEMRDRPVLYTPCGHCFHSRCVRRWLKRKETCPLCRHVIEPKPIPTLFVEVDNELLDLMISLLSDYDNAASQTLTIN